MPRFDSYFFISPLIGAVIGYITNWVAIKMLFRPHEEKRVLGRRIPFTPGLIPSRKHVLAKKIAGAISVHLLTDEALIKSLLSDEVKIGFDSVIDEYFYEINKSGKTIGEIICGENEYNYNKTVNTICERLLSTINNDGILERMKLYGKNVLAAEKTIAEFLPNSVLYAVELAITEKSGVISKKLLSAIEASFFVEHIKPVILDIIDRNLKGLASLFVTPEKVYQNIFDTVEDYLRNEDNYEKTADKLLAAWREVSEIVCTMETLFGGDSADLGAAADSADNEKAASVFEPLINDMKEKTVRKLVETVLNTKLPDAAKEVEATLKAVAMSKYDDMVRGCVPAIIKVINLPNIIESKINELEVSETEGIIVSVVDRELKAITFFGGMLGFVIGIMPPILRMLEII